MGWFGKITFGTMGLLFGGPLGAIAGAALGHHLLDKNNNQMRRSAPFRGVDQRQAAGFISMFSILGKLAKLDGVVSGEEISVVENFLSTLNIPEEQKQFARDIFNESKTSPYSIDDFAIQLYQINSKQPTVLLAFLDLLFKLVAADGKLHQNEEAALRRVKAIFMITDQQFENLKGNYFKEVDDRYYKILNVSPESSDNEIRSSYKKLVKDFHPDRIISKGLPEEFVQFATQRFQEIQDAYENIRRERNF